jgi:hypothetical protein
MCLLTAFSVMVNALVIAVLERRTTQVEGRTQPLVGERRRHADVGDDDVRSVRGDGLGQRGGVADSGDHIVAEAG